MESAKKAVKVIPSSNVIDILYPETMELDEFGDAAFQHVKEQSQESITGPRVYEDVPVLDGALAFANAVKKILGTEITAASIPGYMPNVMSIESQDLVFDFQGVRFTEEDLCSRDKFPVDSLEVIAKAYLPEVPRDIDAVRKEIAHDICKVAPIVGVTAGEISAVMGIVRLQKGNKNFGEAHLSEDDYGNFVLMVKTIKKHEATVRALIKETEVQVRENSMYRGRAYDFSEKKFINDLEFGTDSKIALASELSGQIRAEVSNRLNNEIREQLDEETDSKKCIVLSNGQPGTGKTETARAEGSHAVKNRRAFITYMPQRANVDEFVRFLDFCNKIGPAFVLIEDIEKMIDVSKPSEYSKILEALDGVSSKSQDIEIWINSNNVEIKAEAFRDTFLRRVTVYLDYDKKTDVQMQGVFTVHLPSTWELYGEVTYESDLLVNTGRLPDDECEVHPRMRRLVAYVQEYDFKPWAISQTISKAIHYKVDGGSRTLTEEHLLASAKSVVSYHQMVSKHEGLPSATPTIDARIEQIVEGVTSK